MARDKYRVAVVQFAFDPIAGSEPVLGARDPVGWLLPPSIATSERLTGLADRLRAVYLDQLRMRLEAIFAACHRVNARLVVLPAHAVPAALLSVLSRRLPLMVVAGSFFVDEAAMRALRLSREQRRMWSGQIVAPLLGSLGISEVQPQLRTSPEPWRPCGGPGGGLGVLFGGDVVIREIWDARIAPGLDACSLLAVVDDTRADERPTLLDAVATQALVRPVLLACPVETGGSDVFAPDALDTAAGALAVPNLAPGEEGLRVYELTLGPSPTRRLVSAASLVYQARPVADTYAVWWDSFNSHGAQWGMRLEERNVRHALAEVDESRALLLKAAALTDAPTRRLRLNHLVDHLHGITRAHVLGALTHEVVLPPECLPLPDLHAAFVHAAHSQIDNWQRQDSPGEWTTLAAHLHSLQPLVDTACVHRQAPDLWSAHGQKALRDIHARIVDAWPSAAAPPASPAVRVEGQMLPTTHRFGEFVVKLVARARDLKNSPEPAEHLRALDEALSWLDLSGATDRLILAIQDHDVATALPAIVGRLDGAWHLWTLDPLADRDARLTAVDHLKLQVPPERRIRLDLPALRERLPELLRPYADAVRTLAAERVHMLRDVGGVYEPQHATLDGDEASPLALELLDAWATSNDRLALLLGQPGVGKTTLLHEWAARRLAANRLPLPLPIRLPTSAHVDLQALILHRAGRPDTPDERAALALLLANDHLVPCFDELDGVPEPGRRAALVQALRDLAVHYRILVAARPFHAPEGGGLDVLRGRTGGMRTIHLEQFTAEQVAALVARVHAELGDTRDVLRRIAGIYELADLVRQPLILGMVLQTLDRLDPNAYLDRADIHDAYLRNWLTTPDANVAFVEALALTLWQTGARECTLAELHHAPWRDLAGAPPSGSPFFLIDGGTYRFAHQSFFEYFLARALAEHLHAHPVDLLAPGFPEPAVITFLTSYLRRTATDPPLSRFIIALQAWLTAGPVLDRKRHSVCAGPAALYLHVLGRSLDPTRQWIPPGADLVDVVLTKQDLAGARLTDVDLAGAYLSHCDLRGAVLRRASLGNARLDGARLDGADLREVDARRAYLTGVEADRCDLRGGDFRGAHLDSSNWTECRWDDARLDPHGSRWLNLGGSGTALGHGLPRWWRLNASAGEQRPTRLAWSPDGRQLAFEMLGRAGILDTLSGTVQFFGGPLRALHWAPDGRLAHIDVDGNVHLGVPGDPPELTRLVTLGPSFDLAWRPDDGALVLATWRGLEIEQDGEWTAVQRLAIPREDRMLPQIHASPRGPLVVRDFAGKVHLHTTLTAPPQKLTRSPYSHYDVALAPTGEFLASDGISSIEIYDLRAPEAEPHKLDDRAGAFAWKPGTNRLTYAREPGVLVTYDADRRQVERETWLPARDEGLSLGGFGGSLAWSPTGDRFALISKNSCLQVVGSEVSHVELFVAANAHALWVAGGWCSFSDPSSGAFALMAIEDHRRYHYPLGGLRRVIHRPDLVERTLAGEDVPSTEAALDALGWHSSPDAAGSPGTSRPALAPNRFRPGAPLRDPDLPGRDDILRALTSLLDGTSPAVLKGPRRSGKTSILHALEARHRGTRNVLRRTLEGERPRTPDDLAVILDPTLRGDPSPARALRARLEADERPALVLLDELAWLGDADDELFAWLRVLGQEGIAGLVLSGSHGDWVDLIRKASRTPGSSFGNDYTIVELGPLTDDRALEFLATTAPEDVPIDPQRTGKWIVELCGGWPFYLQIMGHALVEEARSDRRGALVDKPALIELYERKLLDDHGAVFTNRWSDLRRAAQQTLLDLFHEARRTRHNELTPHRELSRTARAALRDADLLDPSRGYKIDRPLRDWLHRNLDDLELHDA